MNLRVFCFQSSPTVLKRDSYNHKYPQTIDITILFGYPSHRPGRPGAAEPSKPRQGRKTATVRKCLWVPPITCSDICRLSYVCLSTQGNFLNCFTVGLKQNLKFT